LFVVVLPGLEEVHDFVGTLSPQFGTVAQGETLLPHLARREAYWESRYYSADEGNDSLG
jgi:hypothetical protein